MKRLLFWALFLFFSCGVIIIQSANATPDIDHPYFQTEEYKHLSEQLKAGEYELDKLNAELKSISDEQRHFSYSDLGILQFLTILPFFSDIIWVLGLSLLFAIFYLFYLKRYNPAKWFIFFKSNDNLDMLLNKFKQLNRLLMLILALALFLPSTGLASTDILTDAKLFLLGNEVERGYVYVKYPVKGRTLSYDKINDIKVYPKFEEGSFEQQYNYLVHESAIGFPPKSPELVRLIEKARSIENLETVYDFIFKLDNARMTKDVVQKRMSFLPKIKNEVRFIEIDAILSRAKATNRLSLVGEDIVATLSPMIAEASETSVSGGVKV